MFEWLGREGWLLVSWWLIATAAGVAVLPLCMRVLGGLPDRGYTLARALGILLVAFVFWLLGILGFLNNSTGSMLLAWAIVLVIGLVAYLRGPAIDLREWWRANRAIVIAAELIFIGLFFAWALVRAQQNGLVATEKPMELAFISAVMRSEAFPPNDPWMAGYAISYYHFGYIITAMFAMLSGVASTVAFNLMVAMLFALTGLTAFGVVANLVRATQRTASAAAPILVGLLGTLFVVVLGNYQTPLIEIPYETGTGTAAYLQAIDSEERLEPRTEGATALQDWDYWWFFRAARVLNDRNLDGSRSEVIDEFPQFSFLLADVHPHVLSLPFAVMTLGLALSVALAKRRPRWPQALLFGVVVGGLIFLNTWDGPIYLAALVGAEGVRRLIASGRGRLSWGDIGQMLLLGLAVGAIAIVAYFPFLASFRSQLGGALPNLLYPTSFVQFFIMFGPLLLMVVGFVLVEAWRAGKRMNWRAGFETALALLGLVLLCMVALALVAWFVPDLRASVLGFIDQNGGWGAVLPDLLQKRATHGFTALFLLLLLVFIVGILFPRRLTPAADADAHDPARTTVHYTASTGFVLMLLGIGALLTLTPEFVYLRDIFSTRMNTVFKFYYQAWVLWSIAAAYGVYAVMSAVEGRRALPAVKAVYGAVTVVAISLGLLYPILGIHYRTQIETGRVYTADKPMTLDGGPTTASPDDYAATLCLGQLVQGDDAVVVSRVGGSYDISIPPTGLSGRLVGIPTLLNWPGHQSQWRGPTYSKVAGSREADIDLLYDDVTWRSAEQVIQQYGIDYIFFGEAERQKYGADAEAKFRDRLPIVCESGDSRFFSTSGVVTTDQTVRG